MKSHNSPTKVNVLGVGIDPLNWSSAIEGLRRKLQMRERGYVCFTNVHSVIEAQSDPTLKRTFAKASFTMPDGMPMVWMGWHDGHKDMRRVAGPDVMLELIAGEGFRHLRHFLYGGKPGIAEELRANLVAKFPWAQIVGTYTPPFVDLSPDQELDFVQQVNTLKPDIVWVGIGAPRQERFMERYIEQLDVTLMLGVGAAFDFHTGRINDCPQWVKDAGLQWFHRLVQDPKHLWRRHARTVPAFLALAVMQILRLRKYSLQAVEAHEAVIMTASESIPQNPSPVLQVHSELMT